MREPSDRTEEVKARAGKLEIWQNDFCDAFEQDAGRLFSCRECWYCKYGEFGIYTEHPQYQIEIYSFSAPIELLAYVEENHRFDVLLLDVYMPSILGTDAARELRVSAALNSTSLYILKQRATFSTYICQTVGQSVCANPPMRFSNCTTETDVFINLAAPIL